MNALETMLALSEEHLWYRMNSGRDRAGKDLADAGFNALAVHYRRERTVTDGVEEVRTRSHGKSEDASGNARCDEREGVAFIPKHKVIVEEYYKSPQLQEQEFITAIANLKVGQRFVRDTQGVRKETVQMLGEPWPFGLSRKRTEEALQRLRNSPHLSEVRTLPPRSTTRKTAAERLGELRGKKSSNS